MIDGPIAQLRNTLDGLGGVIVATESLRDYIGSNLDKPGLPADLDSVIAQYRALRHRSFESDAGAVLLYGAVERFVEELVRGVLLRFAQRLSFAELPQRIQQEHLRMSARLMLNTRALERLEETEQRVLEKAWQCQSGTSPYQLNVGAFIIRDANMWQSVIDKLFSDIGYDNACARACDQKPFAEWHRKEFGRQPSGQVASDLSLLKDLVQLRNELAHGAAKSSPALSEIIRLIKFVRAFGESLHLVAHEHAIFTECDVRHTTLPQPIRIFNNTIVCFELNGQRVKRGDWLVATDGASNRRCGRIEEIHISKQSVPVVDSATAAVKVGLRTDMHAKEGWTWQLVTE